jgi:hypothetical protein
VARRIGITKKKGGGGNMGEKIRRRRGEMS